jgi:hypothetical protein
MITVQADHDDVHVPRAFRDASAALRLQTIRDAEFRDDPELRAAIWNLIQHRYDDPTALLDREFDRCDTLYLVRNISGELLSFQMVSWETIGVDGDEVPTVRIGLLATSGGYVEELSVIQLYRLLFQDVRDREARPAGAGRRLHAARRSDRPWIAAPVRYRAGFRHAPVLPSFRRAPHAVFGRRGPPQCQAVPQEAVPPVRRVERR